MSVRENMSDVDEAVKRLEADPDGRNRVGSFLGADIRTIRAAIAEAQRELTQARAEKYAAENELRIAVERLRMAPLPSDYGVDRDDAPAFWAAYDDWLAKRRLVPEMGP